MEHKLITGGEQFLPFARSRIKALRATGLKYASQQFEIDGCSVKVRIEPGHEYISLSGGTTIEMDSGVVSAPFSPGLGQEFLPGVLQETEYVGDYNMPFVPKQDGFRYNPAAVSNGQFSGKVTYGAGFKGAVPPDNQQARSFSPKRDGAGIPATDDGLLYTKKVYGHECPASIFTGKCRLYVQAMYGRPLYSGKSKSNPTPSGVGVSLEIESYAHEGGATHDPVSINTATGVWLDPETGKHWLFNVADIAVYAYPLVGTRNAESLRRFLVGSNTRLDTEDKEHLEAYILSTCLPDPSAMQVIQKESIGSSYSMGYSWHWAWSTPRADIVINGSYWGGGFADNFGTESTHYSLILSPTHTTDNYGNIVGTEFELTSNIVEGPTRWAVRRFVCTIVEPLWGVGMVKTTAAGARPIACDGFFYAFYKRDILNVCRVTVTENTGVDERRSNGVNFEPWRNSYYTMGLNSAYAMNLAAQPLWWGISVSIGEKSYPDYRLNDVKHGAGYKVDVADGPPAAGTTSYGDGYSTYSIRYGPDLSSGPGTGGAWAEMGPYTGPAYHPPGGVGGAVAKTTGGFHGCQLTTEYNYTTVSHNCIMTIMVPGYDSEAVFVKTRKWVSTTSTGRAVNTFQRYGYLEDQTVHFNTGASTTGTKELWVPHDGFFGNSVNNPDVEVISEDESHNDLICNAGVIPSNFAPTWEFYDYAQDNIEGLYRLTTSVNGAAISQGVIDPHGLKQPAPLSPIFVGWA